MVAAADIRTQTDYKREEDDRAMLSVATVPPCTSARPDSGGNGRLASARRTKSNIKQLGTYPYMGTSRKYGSNPRSGRASATRAAARRDDDRSCGVGDVGDKRASRRALLLGKAVQVNISLTPCVESDWFQLFESTMLSSQWFQ